MNELIEELKLKAIDYADATYQFNPEDGFKIQEWDKIRLDHFAELIVRQVMFEVVEESTRHLSSDVMRFVGSVADRVHDKFGITE